MLVHARLCRIIPSSAGDRKKMLLTGHERTMVKSGSADVATGLGLGLGTGLGLGLGIGFRVRNRDMRWLN